ncbi:hypothetical protein CN330_26755 [Priestia megaterium]|nr:hypothetical protein CN330_26755 [Priestia megaterium]
MVSNNFFLSKDGGIFVNTKRLILISALEHFSKNSFEGASLGVIASKAKIKKSSIYAHFNNKDDLFMSVFFHAEHQVKKRIIKYFTTRFGKEDITETLQSFPYFLLKNCEEEQNFCFLIRHAFFPPGDLAQKISEQISLLLNYLEVLLTKHFRRFLTGRIITQPEAASLAYITLVDGILVESLFGFPEKATLRMKAAWPIFCRGIFLS